MVYRVEKEQLSPLQKKKKKTQSFIPYTKCRSFPGLVLIERTKQNKTKQTNKTFNCLMPLGAEFH